MLDSGDGDDLYMAGTDAPDTHGQCEIPCGRGTHELPTDGSATILSYIEICFSYQKERLLRENGKRPHLMRPPIRIIVAGISSETNTSAPSPACLRGFGEDSLFRGHAGPRVRYANFNSLLASRYRSSMARGLLEGPEIEELPALPDSTYSLPVIERLPKDREHS